MNPVSQVENKMIVWVYFHIVIRLNHCKLGTICVFGNNGVFQAALFQVGCVASFSLVPLPSISDASPMLSRVAMGGALPHLLVGIRGCHSTQESLGKHMFVFFTCS